MPVRWSTVRVSQAMEEMEWVHLCLKVADEILRILPTEMLQTEVSRRHM